VGGTWEMVRPSKYARRFTMETPVCLLTGPAAGHPMMRTAVDPAGRTVRGTLNNCASSKTPWGTYLSGEENWMGYFGGRRQPHAHQRRWGMRKDGAYQWEMHDERFDARKHPNEPNRFGWVVEVDPMDPTSTPDQAHGAGPRGPRGRLGGRDQRRPGRRVLR
jgi:secreted PhoX family phosphatase